MDNKERNQVTVPDNLSAGDLLRRNIICISSDRYDKLIRAEEQREILFHAYQQMDRYDMEKVLDAVFNPKFKYREQNDA